MITGMITRTAARTTRTSSSSDATAWHALKAHEVTSRLQSSAQGLSAADAAARLASTGPNLLPEARPPTLLAILLGQFRSPLVYILLIAAILAAAMGDRGDALFIVAAVVINAFFGAWQEHRADRSSRALQKVLRTRATVLRNGIPMDTDAANLVPGDVIELESGARVPADARLLAVHGLEVDESLLTGESLPVVKSADDVADIAAPLADRLDMVHAGTLVARGRARAVVVATGAATEVGRLAVAVIGVASGEPPLVERLARFSRRIGVAVLIAAAVIAAVGVVARGYGLLDMIIFGIALAVSAIPEGLPVALTVALAVCTRRMSRRGVIVRRLAAVEGLGSCTLIASDKTGTLTCNEITVREAWLPDGSVLRITGEGFAPDGEVLIDGSTVASGLGEQLARAVVLCNEADLRRDGAGWRWRGDPTDVALLAFAHKIGWSPESAEAYPELAVTAFEPEKRFAASLRMLDGRPMILAKGAPERIAAMLGSAADAARCLDVAERLAARGFRVLAVAQGESPAAVLPAEPHGLKLLGLVGMIDPPRPGVREAVAAAANAGVTTIMVTGDHPVTAYAIGRDLGIARGMDEVIAGAELRGFDAERMRETIGRVRVYARVAPDQKLAIVEAGRAAGHYVAVTGDGVNDAPALKAANIGVAMGRGGTDVAREAASLVITDDHYATITAGIEEGRIAYDNIRKIILLLVSTGAAEVLLVGLAVLSGSPLPLTPVQLLWLNLVTNGIQDMSLGFEPGEPGVLRRPPRPVGEPIVNRLMLEQATVAALVMAMAGFGVFRYTLAAGWSEDSARNALLLLMVLFENLHLLNCRSETASAFSLSLRRSPVLVLGGLSALALHVSMLHLPLGRQVLHTEPVDAATWLVLLAVATSIVAALEIYKRLRRPPRPAAC